MVERAVIGEEWRPNAAPGAITHTGPEGAEAIVDEVDAEAANGGQAVLACDGIELSSERRVQREETAPVEICGGAGSGSTRVGWMGRKAGG